MVVELAADGFEAGKKMIRFEPHLVILDLFMPNMDGFDVCKQIKRDTDTVKTKIIAISGRAITNQNAGNCFKRQSMVISARLTGSRIFPRNGIKAFVHKPLVKADLAATVRRVLDAGRLEQKRCPTKTGKYDGV